MKTISLRASLIICGTLVVFATGFFFGGAYSSRRAEREVHGKSLILFAGIHDALDEQKYDRAALLTNTAIDKSVEALRFSSVRPWTQPGNIVPWLPDAGVTTFGLAEVRRSCTTQPDQLRPETRDFLATTR